LFLSVSLYVRYADQDEEDRRLAAIALGHVKPEPAAAPAAPVGRAVDVAAVPAALAKATTTVGLKCFFCSSTEHQVVG
jgi:hypothetical protein